MNTIIESVNNRIAFLKRVIRRAEKEKGSFPKGRLRTSRSNGRIRYYKVSKERDTSGEYLPKNEQMCMIRLLAQKDYNKHFLKSAADELKMLEKMLARYQKNNLKPHMKTYLKKDKILLHHISRRMIKLLKNGSLRHLKQIHIKLKIKYMTREEEKKSGLNLKL